MAARYWVGGTASWDGTAGTKWALTSGGAGGQAVPTTADDVFFTNLSTGTCTVAAGNTGAKSITCTGFTGTLNVTADITVAGSITLVAGMTYTQSTGAVTVTVSAAGTITSAGKTFHRLTIAAGGTVQLADALNCGTAGTLTLTIGTFTTNNFSVTALAFNSSNSNVRTINLGSSTLTFTSSGTGSHAWNTGGFTNLTLNAGTSTINLSGANPSFLMGTLTFNNVTFSNTGSTDTRISNATGTIAGTFTITAPATASVNKVLWDGNPTIGTLVASGASAVRRLMFYTSTLTVGVTKTLTVTTWATISDIDFRDITMNSSRSGTRLGNCGGNTNITFPAAKTVYWNLAGTQNWSATGWATSSGGTPAVNNFPLAQDTVVFDNTGAAGTVTIDSGWNIGTFNASGRTSAITLTSTSNANVYGNWSNGSGITITVSDTLTFANRSPVTIQSSGKVFGTMGITISCFGSTVSLLDAFEAYRFSIDTGTFISSGYSVLFSRYVLGTGISNGTISMGSSTWTINGNGTIWGGTGFTVNAGTSTINLTSATAKTFFGGNQTYYILNQGGAGALTITGANTFNDITNTYAATGATSILFTAGTTSTFSNWSASGQATRLLTIGSVTAASHTLSKASGIVSADYLSISRSTATGGATWYAGANSTDGGNNTGWIFTGPPSGNFLTFFI